MSAARLVPDERFALRLGTAAVATRRRNAAAQRGRLDRVKVYLVGVVKTGETRQTIARRGRERGITGKRAIVEPTRTLSAAELIDRFCAY